MQYIKNILVTKVYDGDTITLEGSIKVRMLGLESFETRKGNKLERQANQFNTTQEIIKSLGKLQKQKVSSILLNRRIDLVLDTKRPTEDYWSRKLGYIRLAPREYFNVIAIRDGILGALLKYPFANLNYYKRLEERAKENKKGIWRLLSY